jgi:hypothetical protein
MKAALIHALIAFCPHLVAARPRCGRLNPSDATDRDSLCVHFVHNNTNLGQLTLLNETASNTVSTEVPASVDQWSEGWWAVRDGVLWATIPGEKGKLLNPFTFTAWFRAPCSEGAQAATGVPGCAPGAHYDIGVSVSLELISARPLKGEHVLSVAISRSSSALAPLHYTARWEPCTLLATVFVHFDAAPSEREARRSVLPEAREPPTWCYDAVVASSASDRASTGGTHPRLTQCPHSPLQSCTLLTVACALCVVQAPTRSTCRPCRRRASSWRSRTRPTRSTSNTFCSSRPRKRGCSNWRSAASAAAALTSTPTSSGLARCFGRTAWPRGCTYPRLTECTRSPLHPVHSSH